MWVAHTFDTFDMVFKGLVIGIASSAPMGPAGVLTVRRTLTKGRAFGFVTGMGAAVSDLIYALAAGWGFSFVLDFADNPRATRGLQLAGAALLFVFGVWLFRSNPAKCIHPPSNRRGTLAQNAITGFLLTFSNPLIVLLFLVLFARFSFVVPGNPVNQTVGYVSLFLGATSWWWGLTYCIHRLGSRFREGGLRRLNQTVGVVVMVMCLLGFYLSLSGKILY